MKAASRPITTLHSDAAARRQMAEDVRRGLSSRPKSLPSRYFYDGRGSALFDRITELPEYYLTRAETEILESAASEIMDLATPRFLVELGAGTGAKSKILIRAGRRLGSLEGFVPFDISESAVRAATAELEREFPGLVVKGVVGDFTVHLERVPRHSPQLLAFLGSTIGNFDDSERHAFLARVRELLGPQDLFLLGHDLVKENRILNAAYNDAHGVTAEFNLNILRHINRELGADFDLAGFQHVAFFDSGRSRVEMHLRSVRHQVVSVPAAGLLVTVGAGELIRTEISAKFTRESMARELAAAGLEMRAWFTDRQGQFGVTVAAPASAQG